MVATKYKIMLCKRTNKYRIMVYTPITSNAPVKYTRTWEDKNGVQYVVQWLQRAKDPMTIVQLPDEESARIMVEDLLGEYNLDQYMELTTHETNNESVDTSASNV